MEPTKSDLGLVYRTVRQALAHLDDVLFLRWHPLVSLLGLNETGEDPGEALQRALLDALESVRPPQGATSGAPAWRRWRCLSLRYLEAAPAERILQELGTSGRQMRRDHSEAVEALASVLWTRYRSRTASPDIGRSLTVIRRGAGADLEPVVDAEVARMGSAPRQGPVSLAEVLDSTLALVNKLAQTQGVTYGLAVSGEIAPVAINRGVLRQVLVALLSYAAEASPNTRIEVTATAGSRRVNLSLRLRNRTGPGPLPGTVDVSRLAISQQLIKLQGGAIECGEDEDGVTIVLELPAAELSTVLVIDDNPDLVQLFDRYLRNFGYRVIKANDGQSALRLVSETPPDLIILDLMIPTQDGWEILQHLQSHEKTRGIPIVVCSVLREQALALSLGAADFLVKPVTQQTLLAALARCQARRGQRPGLT